MRHQGRITKWKDEQGFGFITPNGGGKEVFLHIKSFARGQRRPVGDELVTYTLRTDAKGRAQAEAVLFVGAPLPAVSGSRRGASPLVAAAAFLIFVATAVAIGRLPVAVLGLYVAASVVAFAAYAMDKSAARQGAWRTKESTLHLFALIGGWPGALAAQRLLRHKSSKQSFQAAFWATVVLNCAALGWLLSSSGARVLESLLTAV